MSTLLRIRDAGHCWTQLLKETMQCVNKREQGLLEAVFAPPPFWRRKNVSILMRKKNNFENLYPPRMVDIKQKQQMHTQ